MVTEFTIDRSRWARRGKNGLSKLLNDQGGMCCLGFFAEACGVEPEKLLWKGTPARLYDPRIPGWLVEGGVHDSGWSSREAGELMNANDHEDNRAGATSEEALEAFITQKFASHGVTVHFVDGPVAA